jgi:hypothetical protein
MIKNCACGDPGYPLYGKAFNLDVSKAIPICSHINAEQQKCLQNINLQYSNNSLSCDCPDSCKDISYATGLSIGQWPSNVQKDDILESLQKKVSTMKLKDVYKDNLIKVELFFESFDFEAIREVPAYLFSKFLSDIGGVLGLWLGMSLLTIFEFVEFGIDLAIIGTMVSCMKCKSKNQVDDVSIKPSRSNSMSPRPQSTASKLEEGLDKGGNLEVDEQAPPGFI